MTNFIQNAYFPSKEMITITKREKAKRHFTGKALKNVVTQILDHSERHEIYQRNYKASRKEIVKLNELGKARRRLTGEAIKKVLTQKLAEKFSTDKMYVQRICTLIGMWISVKTSLLTSYIIESDACVIDYDVYRSVKYRPLKGKWCQVKLFYKDKKIEELKVQLLKDHFLIEEQNRLNNLD
ncbi:uncharacterized protein LOC126836952 [Adelges cooleyi]|uniref:uncharacterized protein LOC126836952 n=1 Tax=Adelges cooleyi TaxID=133065 RepID=UPI0021802D73|nr:uncharacterized protein LOC126836952 [Adelges cooleyi]